MSWKIGYRLKLVKSQSATRTEPKPAFVVVRVEGVIYTGEYDSERCDGYKPGEFAAGGPIRVRFHEDSLYIRRPNGLELEAKIVKKVSGQ